MLWTGKYVHPSVQLFGLFLGFGIKQGRDIVSPWTVCISELQLGAAWIKLWKIVI